MTEPLRLSARCPVCGAPPAIRVPRSEVDRKRGLPPDEVVSNVRCERCGEQFDITVKHYLEAA